MSYSGLTLNKVLHNFQNWSFQITIQFKKGSLNGILGASGAGKSTLLSLIAGFEPIHTGEIFFDDIPITHLPPKDRPVSMIFQEHNLFPHLTAFQNTLLGLSPGLKADDTQKEQIYKALDRVGLKDKENRLPKTLSGGERQRVVIARILVMRRPVLLLDEPFTALGPALREEMLMLIKELSIENNLTVLLVSHSPEDLIRFAEKTAFIHDGKLLCFTPTKEVLEGSEIPEIRNYLQFRK